MHYAQSPRQMGWVWAWSAVCAWLAAASPVSAQEAIVDTVLEGLHRPSGVVARPGGTADRYEMFVAESGARRVIRWSNQAPDQTVEVVTGFAAKAAKDSRHSTGPLALEFLDPGLLIVGATAEGERGLLRAYELPDEGVLTADQAVEMSAAGDAEKSVEHGGSCFALTRSRANGFVPDILVVAFRGGAEAAELMKCRLQAGTLGTLQPFPASDADPPRALATSSSGRIVAADATGRITFYNPIDGKAELSMSTDLPQISGLTYSPTHGRLYAADLAGGVYRIDDASEPGRPACRVVKVADVRRPTALAFAPDGALYVTTAGDANANGTLVVVTGDL